MTARTEVQVVGAAAAACAVCCAGPILGALAALGLGTAAGLAVFGMLSLVAGVVIAALFVLRSRRRVRSCARGDAPTEVPVELTDLRSGSS